jgi:hypothetical protein
MNQVEYRVIESQEFIVFHENVHPAFTVDTIVPEVFHHRLFFIIHIHMFAKVVASAFVIC